MIERVIGREKNLLPDFSRGLPDLSPINRDLKTRRRKAIQGRNNTEGRRQKAEYKRLILSLIPYSLFLSLLCLSCNKHTQPTVEIVTQNNKTIRVNVEVADTPGTREQGLMYRDSLPEDSGMLFIMENEQNQTFWMKDTRISLDIIFIFSDWKIAGIAENTKTYSTDRISIDKPSKYVLEVNAGFCKKHGIQAGDKIIYHPSL